MFYFFILIMKKTSKLFKSIFLLPITISILLSCQSTTQETIQTENSSEKVEITETQIQKNDLANIKISLVSNTNIPVAGAEFKNPILVCVKDKDGNPCPNYDLVVTYPTEKVDNNIKFATKEISTDEKGIASFKPIPISSSIKSFVTFTPKLSSFQSKLAKSVALEVPLKVRFLIVKKGIMINLVDYNEKDKMELNSALSTSSNLVGEFWRAGYTSAQNADFHTVIDKGSQAVSQAAKNLVQGSTYFKYIIYGKVKYASQITEVENGFSLTLTGTATVINFADGTEISTIQKTTTVVDKNKWNVLKACQVQLAKDLADELIYSM